MAQRLDLLAPGRGDVRCRPDRGAGVAGRRLNKKLLQVRQLQQALVELDVEGDAAGKTEPSGLAQDITEIGFDQGQGGLFEPFLESGGIIDIRVVDLVAPAHGTEPANQVGTEIVAPFFILVASQADHIHEPGIDLETPPVTLPQGREIETVGVAVGCHAHDLELPVEHLEAQVLGHRPVDPA